MTGGMVRVSREGQSRSSIIAGNGIQSEKNMPAHGALQHSKSKDNEKARAFLASALLQRARAPRGKSLPVQGHEYQVSSPAWVSYQGLIGAILFCASTPRHRRPNAHNRRSSQRRKDATKRATPTGRSAPSRSPLYLLATGTCRESCLPASDRVSAKFKANIQ